MEPDEPGYDEKLTEANRIYREIQNDKRACELMRDKCRWEHMSWIGVIMDFGDPRTWKRYKK